MAMSKGIKIAIGCALAAVALTGFVVIAIFGAAWWARGKVGEVVAEKERIDALRAQANEVPFTRPADGIVIEERLRAFLEIRRRVFPTYEKHKDQLASTAEKGVTGVGELTRALATAKDLAMARALAQAEVGMSDSEYYFMIHQVYRTAWTGREAGRGEGQDVAAPVVDRRGAPPENVVLFRKYEKTIREYAMPGMDGGKLD